VPATAALEATTLAEPVWELGIGIGDTALRPVVLRLGPGEGALVAGGARSGKSSVLRLLADAAAGSSVQVLGVSFRASPLRDARLDQFFGDPGALAAWLEGAAGEPDTPRLLLVDDADLVDDPSGRLAALLQQRRPGLRVVAAGRSETLRAQYGHWTTWVRRHRTGLLLLPLADSDSELLQIALPRQGTWQARPGLGYLVSEGRAELVQVAAPATIAPFPAPGVPLWRSENAGLGVSRAKHHEIAREGRADD
jgi:S-DNA-T family DNA segregation ATPase FtsK/SpoIIIE